MTNFSVASFIVFVSFVSDGQLSSESTPQSGALIGGLVLLGHLTPAKPVPSFRLTVLSLFEVSSEEHRHAYVSEVMQRADNVLAVQHRSACCYGNRLLFSY